MAEDALQLPSEFYGALRAGGHLVAFALVRSHFRVPADIVADESEAEINTVGDAVKATFVVPTLAVNAAPRMREWKGACAMPPMGGAACHPR